MFYIMYNIYANMRRNSCPSLVPIQYTCTKLWLYMLYFIGKLDNTRLANYNTLGVWYSGHRNDVTS